MRRATSVLVVWWQTRHGPCPGLGASSFHSGTIMASHADASDWFEWTTETLISKMTTFYRELAKYAKMFEEKKTTGKELPTLTDKDLEVKFGMNKKDMLKMRSFINDTIVTRKVFMDPIHGNIVLHPLCVKIIDTPSFQRLRNLKQLGACYLVYPQAVHTRFEHSIGVCHLAGRLARHLQLRQPDLEITENDILCVEIAGLCHDLGHGPFSHLFDQEFIPRMTQSKWTHEEQSVKIFKDMLDTNGLRTDFSRYGLEKPDINFIEEQIAGPKTRVPGQSWKYEGRGSEKGFLYEIVANKKNGVDVDKWDYIARDCYMLGIKNSFDHARCMEFVRVINVAKKAEDPPIFEICTRDKEASNLYEMYHARCRLHQRALQHRVKNVIDEMITEAMILFDGFWTYKSTSGNEDSRKQLEMSEAKGNMEAYIQLTDNVFFQILYSTEQDEKAKRAREILQKVQNRKLYKLVAEARVKTQHITKTMKDLKTLIKEMPKQIVQLIEDDPSNEKPKPEDVLILPANINYGLEKRNPLDDVCFYVKDNPNKAIKIKKTKVSSILPANFAEQLLRVHFKGDDKQSINKIRKAFTKYCNKGDSNYIQTAGEWVETENSGVKNRKRHQPQPQNKTKRKRKS